MREKLLIARKKVTDKGRLAQRVELAVGMQVMVTLNLATEADLANGSRGTVERIVLDPREPPLPVHDTEEGVVRLEYPPVMIVFRPFHYEFAPIPGFEPGLIPIFPFEVSFTVDTGVKSRTPIKRRQYALVSAYAFTDHKSQGQTLDYAIVDIGIMRRFPVDPFAAYVALSRSRGRKSIRLLRDFDPGIFTKHLSESLRLEDQRLNGLSEQTRIKFEAGQYNFQ